MPPQAAIVTRELPVQLTEDEYHIRSAELATAERIFGEKRAAEAIAAEKWKGEKQALKEDTETAYAKLTLLGRVVREKREFRAVQIVEQPDHERRVVDTVRIDTGEIVESRGMTPAELQRTLFAVNAQPIEDAK